MARQEKELNNRMDLQILDMKGLLAMKPNRIVFSIVLCMIIGCTENPIETNINEKYGYSLSAYFDGNLSDSSLYIKICFNGIQHDLPKISIDNQQIDTGYYPDYFFHEITNFRRNSFKYTIEIDNDRIEDSIIIPSRIDSIYCNSKLLKDTMNLVLDSSSFVFSWKKSERSILYSFQLWNNFSKDIIQISGDTTVLILPYKYPLENVSSHGSIYLYGISYPKITYLSKPNMETKKQFIYYDGISGPYSEVNFYIQ